MQNTPKINIDNATPTELLRIIDGQLAVLSIEGYTSHMDYYTWVESESEHIACPQCDNGLVVDVEPDECMCCAAFDGPCDICHDTGYIGGVEYDCPVCDGTGLIWIDRNVTYYETDIISNIFI